MDYFSNLNSSEKDTLEKLKERLDGKLTIEQKNDHEMLVRFLRARDFKIDLAEDMLRKHLQWKLDNKIDSILTDYVPNEVLLKYVPISRLGFDKDGSPIRYFDFGSMDLKGLLKTCKKTDIVKYLVYCFENDVKIMKEQSLKLKKTIFQWTYITNFNGFSLFQATHKPTIDFLLHLFNVYEANYPERLKATYLINTSVYFTMIYSVIKPFLSGATIRKLLNLGKDGWESVLLKAVDSEVLPAFLGGKRTDPDGNSLCRTIVNHGETVPEKYCRIKYNKDARKLIISGKTKTNLSIIVDIPESIIEWEFETENGDINFGLFYKENSSTKSSFEEELIPSRKIDAEISTETGMYKCYKPGIYLLVFDNTHCLTHNKEVYCRISQLPPTLKTDDDA